MRKLKCLKCGYVASASPTWQSDDNHVQQIFHCSCVELGYLANGDGNQQHAPDCCGGDMVEIPEVD